MTRESQILGNECRQCGAVLAGDRRCRYCGTPAGSKGKKKPVAATADAGLRITLAAIEQILFPALLVMALLAAIAISLYVIPVPVWFQPGSRLVIILATLFIGSALFVMLDAAQLAINEDFKVALGRSPVRWFLFTLVAWFGAMPLYVRTRSGLVSSQPPWAVGAATTASAIVLIVALLGVGFTINKGSRKARDKAAADLLLKRAMERYGSGSVEEIPPQQ